MLIRQENMGRAPTWLFSVILYGLCGELLLLFFAFWRFVLCLAYPNGYSMH